MIDWETLLSKIKNLTEPSAIPEHLKLFKKFKSTKEECDDLNEISKLLEKEIRELENKLVQ